MSLFVLYHRNTRPTGRLLASALGLPGGTEPPRGAELIRWGNARNFPGTTDFIQPARAIAHAGNKWISFQDFERAGVPHPKVTLSGPTDTGVWLARKCHGFGGTDIVVMETSQSMATAEFYSKFIPNDREYRLHVCDGKIIRFQRKYLDHPDQKQSEYVKNYANGYRFRQPQRELRADRIESAQNAVKAVGLDFGAVDLIIGSDDDKPYVLEVNTAPKCSPLTGRKYTDAIGALAAARGHALTLNTGAWGNGADC